VRMRIAREERVEKRRSLAYRARGTGTGCKPVPGSAPDTRKMAMWGPGSRAENVKVARDGLFTGDPLREFSCIKHCMTEGGFANQPTAVILSVTDGSVKNVTLPGGRRTSPASTGRNKAAP